MIEKWQNYLLPPSQLGFGVPTTSVGIVDHEETRRNQEKRSKRKFRDSFCRDVCEHMKKYLKYCRHQKLMVPKKSTEGTIHTLTGFIYLCHLHTQNEHPRALRTLRVIFPASEVAHISLNLKHFVYKNRTDNYANKTPQWR